MSSPNVHDFKRWLAEGLVERSVFEAITVPPSSAEPTQESDADDADEIGKRMGDPWSE